MPLEEGSNLEGSISRLLEDESLTEDVDDAPAKVLLEWGIERLKGGQESTGVRRTIKTLARLVRDRRRLSPEEARQRLERVVGPALPAGVGAALEALWAEGSGLPAAELAGRLGALVGQALAPGGASGLGTALGAGAAGAVASTVPAGAGGRPAGPVEEGSPGGADSPVENAPRRERVPPWRRWARFWRRGA